MNSTSRGIRNALRSPLRSGAIVIMLAISIGLIVAMLVARSSVNAKISEVKSESATKVTVRPAGVMGGFGGGDPLTAEQVEKITKTAHVASTSATLTDQLGKDDTSLTPSFELGQLGQRLQRFESRSGDQPQSVSIEGGPATPPANFTPVARTTITGTTDPNSATTDGSSLKITSGETINGTSADLTSLIGKTLAEKNNLKPGSTFTAYGKTFTVKGIFETDNRFQDNGLMVPLKTLQDASAQAGAVTNIVATVDSADNVSSTVTALKTSLGDKADITSEADRAARSVTSLESISSLATTGVIGATVAAAVIVFLTMTIIVRERRREIGVIKAIGGTNFKVITQFVSEALTLTLIGGIVGLGIGIAASGSITESLVANQQSTPQISQRGPAAGGPAGEFGGQALTRINRGVQTVSSTVTPDVFAIAAGCILLIAIIGSAIPAWLIARVRPAEVLRTE